MKILKIIVLSIVIMLTYIYVYKSGKSYAYSQIERANNCICMIAVESQLSSTLSKEQKDLMYEIIKKECQPLMKKKV